MNSKERKTTMYPPLVKLEGKLFYGLLQLQ